MKVLIKSNMLTNEVVRDYERIFQIPLANSRMDDERRTIHEDDDEVGSTSTQAFLVKKSNLPLGNHFHRNKVEAFFILDGGVERLITSDENGESRQEYVDIPRGSLIVIPPGVAHTFFLAADSRMICYASERFDPNDMPQVKLA